jgi:hypothetical protein
MSSTAITFVKLQQELQKALSTIEDSTEIKSKLPESFESAGFPMAQSLLERCEEIVQKNNIQVKPTIRVLQHFACSGGTLVSKCFAALPNVYLLSEAHPSTELHMGEGKAKFLPSDVTSMARYAKIPDSAGLAHTLFKQNIITTARHTERLGGKLIIREHTHSDYCVGKKIAKNSTVINILSEEFNILQLATIRDPIDAYCSLTANNWIHFDPGTFEEYCQRFLVFVNTLEDKQIIRYEDFVDNPTMQMQVMADKLELPFDECFMDTFSIFRVSGDSGRRGEKIEPRDRKALSDDFKKEILNSKSYRMITKRFGYDTMGVEND